MDDDNNQVDENDIDGFADFVSVVAAPIVHDQAALSADAERRPKETDEPSWTGQLAAEPVKKEQDDLQAGGNHSTPSSPSEELNEGFRKNGSTAASTTDVEDGVTTSDLAAADNSDKDDFGSFEDALQDAPDVNGSKASEDTDSRSMESTRKSDECLNEEPIPIESMSPPGDSTADDDGAFSSNDTENADSCFESQSASENMMLSGEKCQGRALIEQCDQAYSALNAAGTSSVSSRKVNAAESLWDTNGDDSSEWITSENSDGCNLRENSSPPVANDVKSGVTKDEESEVLISDVCKSPDIERTPDLVVSSSKEQDEPTGFGDSSSVKSAEDVTDVKHEWRSSPIALASPCEEGDDQGNLRSPDGENEVPFVKDDDNESDDDFGDFDEAPPADCLSKEPSGDTDDNDFANFDAAPEVDPAASTTRMPSSLELPVIQKANQVFQKLFTRHENLSYPSYNEPTSNLPARTLQSILETKIVSQVLRANDSGALMAHLDLSADKPKPMPSTLIINEVKGPYSHYSLPLGGIHIRQAKASTRTEISGTSSFNLPDVLNIHLPPSPGHQESIAPSPENGVKSKISSVIKPEQPEDENKTQVKNAVDGKVAEDFITRIPDLSFMLSSTFAPPNG